MISIEENIWPDGFINYSLSEAYNTHKHFHSGSDHNAKLNFDSLVRSYDFDQCLREYEEDDETDDEGCPIHDLDYYINQAPRLTEQGLFLHFSDDGDSFLRRDAVIRLTVDEKNYRLPCYFAPNGHKIGCQYTTDLYFRINNKLLKELAGASSIKLSYETKDEKEHFENLSIDDFQKYALSYYEGYYIEHQGTPEEKEKLRQELRAQEEAKKEREADEKAQQEQRAAEKKAARKAEWEEADPLSKVWIMLKRNWKLVLLILLILYCWAKW